MKRNITQIALVIFGTIILVVITTAIFFPPLVKSFQIGLLVWYLVVINVIFFSGFALGSYLLVKNQAEIRLQRKNYHQVKPYLIRINQYGLIETYNAACEHNIKDFGRYKTVYDFDLVRETYDLVQDISRQLSFTACFESAVEGQKFIRFQPLKSGKKYYLIGENITHFQKDYEYHRNISLFNSVTKLPNKNFFGIKLQELFDDPHQRGKRNSLVALDISGFRNINKLFGYKIANQTLIELGKIIQETGSKYSMNLFHLEEDTFMILFSRMSKNQVEEYCEDLLETLKKPVRIKGNLFNIEVNIGIFYLDTDKYPDLNPVQALKNTIIALTKAGDSKITNLIVYDQQLGKDYQSDQALENDLAAALSNNELNVHFQPQYNLSTKKIVGFEALLRWNNPQYLGYSPTKLIEVAEHSHLIIEVGRFVLREVLNFAALKETENLNISFNLSPFQLLHQGFVEELLKAYDQKQSRSRICLEITESLLIESHQEISDTLTALKNKGYAIRLDDFGFGSSSMIYLKDFPLDALSIHRDCIKNIHTDKTALQAVLKIISLARSLDLEVLAEGVENEKQCELLQANGCHLIQGHLISSAVPQTEALMVLNHFNSSLNND